MLISENKLLTLCIGIDVFRGFMVVHKFIDNLHYVPFFRAIKST